MTTDVSLLPPRYRMGKPVSNAPMGSADLKFGADGKVVWDEMWTDFCDLALAGDPPMQTGGTYFAACLHP